MTIEQIITENKLHVSHGEIRLGTENSWDAERYSIYESLRAYIVPNSGTSRNLGRCYNEYSFTVNDGTSEYVVVYSVDSSD